MKIKKRKSTSAKDCGNIKKPLNSISKRNIKPVNSVAVKAVINSEKVKPTNSTKSIHDSSEVQKVLQNVNQSLLKKKVKSINAAETQVDKKPKSTKRSKKKSLKLTNSTKSIHDSSQVQKVLHNVNQSPLKKKVQSINAAETQVDKEAKSTKLNKKKSTDFKTKEHLLQVSNKKTTESKKRKRLVSTGAELNPSDLKKNVVSATSVEPKVSTKKNKKHEKKNLIEPTSTKLSNQLKKKVEPVTTIVPEVEIEKSKKSKKRNLMDSANAKISNGTAMKKKVSPVASIEPEVETEKDKKSKKRKRMDSADAKVSNQTPRKSKVTSDATMESKINVEKNRKIKKRKHVSDANEKISKPSASDKKILTGKIMKPKRKNLTNSKKAETPDGSNQSICKKKRILSFVQALMKIANDIEKKKKTLFGSEKPAIFLTINCMKIPKVPLHQHRILLPHSCIKPTDDVALFVRDMKKGRRRDYEDTVHHYEDILESKGCKSMIKSVIPFNQVKTEYTQYEMKRRLLSSYDFFLIDGRIAGHMAHVLGKIFRKKKKLPIPVHIDKDDLKSEIERSLKKTTLEMHSFGDSYCVQIGTCSMSDKMITDNIMTVIEDLSQHFPGGWENIRSLSIKTSNSMAIPIYLTLKNKNEVKVPVVLPKRPKAYKDVEGELSTFVSNVNVTVSPEGNILVHKTENDADNIEDDSDNEVKSEEDDSISRVANDKETDESDQQESDSENSE